MTKKNKSSHTEAKKYLDTYTGKIREKFLDQKKEKELFDAFQISSEGQEKRKVEMKEEMKKFVQELQSDQNYNAMKKIYHEQMHNIHEFNKLIHNYTQELEKLQMKEHTKLAKEKFFDENVKVWATFIKKFKTAWDGLTSREKQKTFKEMDKLMNDRTYFNDFISEFSCFEPDEVSVMLWLGSIGSVLFLIIAQFSLDKAQMAGELLSLTGAGFYILGMILRIIDVNRETNRRRRRRSNS